jgi:predicted nucleotidyltransferase
MTDQAFLDRLADPLCALPGVQAVTLGGSRAQGTARHDSDWDLAVYYRGTFEPQHLRDLGWTGEVSEIGGWGGGVFNGGAWLEVEDRRVDVHYRDLDVVEREIARARRGEVAIEPLMFHLAGIPTYLLVAELATHRVLRGSAPAVDAYPEALRRAAPPVWQGRAEAHLAYARDTHARHGRVTPCLGLLAVAAAESAHAVLAARGEWVTNDKRLLTAAGLGPVDAVVARVGGAPEALADAVDAVADLARAALADALAGPPAGR